MFLAYVALERFFRVRWRFRIRLVLPAPMCGQFVQLTEAQTTFDTKVLHVSDIRVIVQVEQTGGNRDEQVISVRIAGIAPIV